MSCGYFRTRWRPSIRARRARSSPKISVLPILRALPDRPVAAASIGQVYRVELPDGRLLAVKVQRPLVAAQVAQDLALARGVATWLETLRYPTGRRLLQPEHRGGCNDGTATYRV